MPMLWSLTMFILFAPDTAPPTSLTPFGLSVMARQQRSQRALAAFCLVTRLCLHLKIGIYSVHYATRL